MRALRFAAIGLAICAALLSPAPTTAGEEEALTRLPVVEDVDGLDRWYGVYLGGKKSGWAHETITRHGGGAAARWIARMDARIRVGAMGKSATVQMGEIQVFDGNAPYAFLRKIALEHTGEHPRRTDVRRIGDGMRAEITEAGETRTRTGPAPDYTFADYTTSIAWIRTHPRPGDVMRARSYDPEDFEEDVSIHELEAIEEHIAGGVPVEVYRIATSSGLHGESGVTRVDADGLPLTMTLGGMFEIRVEPEEVAKRLEVGGDLFMLGTVAVDQPLGHPTKVRRLVLEVGGESRDALSGAPRQTLTREGDRVILSLGAAHAQTFEATEEELEQGLEETSEYPITHPDVVALALRAIGDADTDRKKVERLVTFVGKHVKDESMASGLSVMELVRTPRGDCSEHALLFTALARAVGVPARDVSGLMYMGDKIKRFGGHAWNEVVLDGRWTPVDATWNQMDVDATHVTLSRTEKDGFVQMKTFGRIEFTLREIEKRP